MGCWVQETPACGLGGLLFPLASPSVANFQHLDSLSPTATQISGLRRVHCPSIRRVPTVCQEVFALDEPSPSLSELVFRVGSLADELVRLQGQVPGREKAERIREGQTVNREVREASQRK